MEARSAKARAASAVRRFVFPNLLLAMRRSGWHQYEIARRAEIPESRLSKIVRRGDATPAERHALSRVLDVPEADLFASREGPPISMADQPSGKGTP